MHPSQQHDPFVIKMEQGFLYMAEKTYGTREVERHGPDLPNNLVPVFDTDPSLVREDGGKDFLEAEQSRGGQAQRHVDCVHYQT